MANKRAPNSDITETNTKRAKTDEAEEEKVEPTRRSRRNTKDVDYTAEGVDAVEGEYEPFPGVMLASKYKGEEDIKGWLMSEKLDGVRCVWNGEKMFTRNGNSFFPPAFFTEGLPKDTTLDGELFLGRGQFSEAMSIVRR